MLLHSLLVAAFLAFTFFPVPTKSDVKTAEITGILAGHWPETPACGNPRTELSPLIVNLQHSSGGRGSGIIIKPHKILTAAHVMSYSIDSYKIDGPGMNHPPNKRNAILGIQRNDSDDLALLTIRTGETKPVKIADTPLEPFEKVWVIGIPLVYTNLVVEGRFQRIIPKGFNKWVESDTSFIAGFAAQGMSGGGVFRCRNSSYELAGVIRGVGISSAYNAAGPVTISVHTLMFATSQHVTKQFIDDHQVFQ